MKKGYSKRYNTQRQSDTKRRIYRIPGCEWMQPGVIHMEDTVKESELIGKVHSAVYHQCQQRGYAAPYALTLMQIHKISVIIKQR